jgi:beta-lactam-binding protein with PASTA domain
MPGRRSLLRLASIAAALLACGSAPPAHAQLTTGAVAQQTMPSVTGMSQGDASGRLRQLGMQVEVREMASQQPRGTVVRQSPSPGTAIKQGGVAVLGVSTGPRSSTTDTTPRNPTGGQVQPTDGGRGGVDIGISVRPPRPGLVPNVVGMTLGAARARLLASALRPGRVDSAFVEGFEPGRVVAQSLRPGSQVIPGRSVRLTVQQRAPVATQPPVDSTPPPPRRTLVAVPNLAGRTLAEARLLVGGARLLLGDVDSTSTQQGRAGTVVGQRPAAGDSVEPGTLVRISVARPPALALVVVPDLAGRSPAEARRVLTAARLSPGAVTQRDAAGPPHVLGQSVAAGSRVLPGTTVGIVVSRTPVVVRPDTPRTPAGAPVVDSAAAGQTTQTGQPQAATPGDSAAVQSPVTQQPVHPVTPTGGPATRPAGVPAKPTRSRPIVSIYVPREWIEIVAALLLLAAAGGLYLRARRAARRPAPVAAAPVPAIVTVRAKAGGSGVARQPERPLEKGRVKIGVVVGPPRVPEPEAGAAALGPGRLVVRLADAAGDDPLGEHPQRVTEGGQVRVRVVSAQPRLERDEGAVILKRS